MTAVYYTSDPHFGHRLVAGLRGFVDDYGPDTGVHDQVLALHWRQTVARDDHVWVLGDLSLGNPERALALLDELPGHKHLVPGNHDKCHPMFRDAFKWQPRYLEVFDSVQPFARRKIAGQTVLLSHFPYKADRGETRFPQWRLPDMGEWLLHGHTHSSHRWTSRNEIHVGLDAWRLRLVSTGQIEAMMAERAMRDDEAFT